MGCGWSSVWRSGSVAVGDDLSDAGRALTLALVFVIQHTQAREQLVTQRKLDELLQALSRADNAVIGLEDASDAELAAVHDEHRALREEATGNPKPPLDH
jgi:low affinity Fe/Cu permease